MRLLSFRRMAADEGPVRAAGIVLRTLRDPVARRRVRAMRRAFHQYRSHLAGVGFVARPTAVPARPGPEIH